MKIGSALLFAAAVLTAQQVTSDQQFVISAAYDELTQVKLGQAAYQNASNPQVKVFAKEMVDEHAGAVDKLMGIAALDNLSAPTELDKEHQAEVDQLSKTSGAAFDKAYLAEVIKEHRQDLALYQKEVTAGSSSDLKSWAAAEILTIQDHIERAQKLAASLGAI
jgi:putative membrane protein